jgi:hypothetical protein
MKTYKVKWEIDIQAASPEAAAREALACQRELGSTATYFQVVESLGGALIKTHEIDLHAIDA